MKNSILIIAFLLLSIGTKTTAGGNDISYIKTRDTVYFGQDIKIGLFNSKLISPDGSVTKISNHDIIAYMHDSRLYEYLPVMSESNVTLCYSMMEYITKRSGFKLYRYNCYDEIGTKCYYFVFKDGKFYLRIDPKNALTVLPFFGIKNIKFSES